MRGYLGAAVIFLVSSQVQAHIVPPEQFHPTVESYRRAMFLLNLNPVIWDQVKTDTDRVAMGLETVSGERANAYRLAVSDAISKTTAP